MHSKQFNSDFLRIRSSHRHVVLFITHRRGGGTERHINELAHHLDQDAEILVLRPYLWRVVSLEWIRPGEKFRLFFRMGNDYPALLNFLQLIGVSQIHYHHLFGHKSVIRSIPGDLGIPFYFTVHDYYSICPRISLTSTDSRYCGEPDAQQCHNCLKSKPHTGIRNIQRWRDQHRQFLSQARRIFVPSNDAVQRILKYFDFNEVVLAPHLDISPETEFPSPRMQPLEEHEKLRIVILGRLSQIKGAGILEACAKLADQEHLPLSFHLIGDNYRDMATLPNLTIYGPYKDSDLLQLIVEVKPHLIWFPAQWPETYSYTLSAALMSGTPVVVTNLGALPERVALRPWSWVCDWNWTTRQWSDFFMQFRKTHLDTDTTRIEQPSLERIVRVTPHNNYRSYILKPKNVVHPLSDTELQTVRQILATHYQPRFSRIEWGIIEMRKVISLLTPLVEKVISQKWFGKFLSTHNRTRLKEWLAGQWPA